MRTRNVAGETIGQYEVIEKLAEGGMATVYRAHQPVLGREVALKILSPTLAAEPGFIQRFANEARTLAKLDHPNVLPVYDFGSFGDLTYIACPMVLGGTLADLLRDGPVDPVRAVQILAQIGDALHHAHTAGVTHRDLKPSNILLHPDGRAILGDFGLARGSDTGSSLTLHGTALGTPGYMAPEQAIGAEVDARTDIYAFAVITFELLAGTRPYAGNTREVLTSTMQSEVPSVNVRNPVIPAAVDAVIAHGMARNPAERPATVKEFLAELTRALGPVLPAPSAAQLREAAEPSTASVPATPSNLTAATTVWPPVTPTPPPPTPEGEVALAGNAPSRRRPLAQLFESGLVKAEPQTRVVLNAHFAHAFHAATHLAGERWIDLVTTSGLQYLLTDPADDDTRKTPVHELAWLNEGMELTFGSHAVSQQRRWGALTMQLEIERTAAFKKLQRRIRLMPAGHKRRIRDLLTAWCERMDNVRGESLHSWHEMQGGEFWVAVQDNAYVFGKRKPQPSCHALVGQLETLLRWTGLANHWNIEEIECGCVDGSDACVFAVTPAGSA
ncbi:MAG TPA: serine/threonine-protein kinase [Candidatus Dormibacteraeota bacterium]